MPMKTFLRAAALVAGVMSFAGAALGDDARAKADTEQTAKSSCITDTSGFKMHGKTPVYEMTLQNACVELIKCKVYLSVETARGSTRGEATLLLEGRKQGEPPTKSYALKVKMLSGMARANAK
jgi:hypothetical protein